ADEPGVQPVGALPHRVVGAQKLDTGDRLQLAASLMEEQLDVRERLKPRAEPGLRLADALGDRPDPAAPRRVEGKDPVGLGESHRSCTSWPFRPKLQTLAAGAVPRAATGDADLVDRRAAALARLAGSAVDLELVLHRPGLTVR